VNNLPTVSLADCRVQKKVTDNYYELLYFNERHPVGKTCVACPQSFLLHPPDVFVTKYMVPVKGRQFPMAGKMTVGLALHYHASQT